MKSKILSFLSLLIMMVVSTSAWAATATVSWTAMAEESANATKAGSASATALTPKAGVIGSESLVANKTVETNNAAGTFYRYKGFGASENTSLYFEYSFSIATGYSFTPSKVSISWAPSGGKAVSFAVYAGTSTSNLTRIGSVTHAADKDYGTDDITVSSNFTILRLVPYGKDGSSIVLNNLVVTGNLVNNGVTASSEILSGIKVADSKVAESAYEVADGVITLAESYMTPPTVALIKTTSYSDNTSTNSDVSVTFALNEGKTFYVGEVEIGTTKYTVKVPVKALSTTLADVTGTTTWDWTKTGSTEIKLTDTSYPSKTDEFVLGNLIANTENFNSDALKVQTEYAVRDGKYFQGGKVLFHTTKAGTVKVTFSNTGNRSADDETRYLYVNGVKTEWGSKSSSTNDVVTGEIPVEAGDVVLTAQMPKVANQDQYIRVYKIEFTEATTPEPEWRDIKLDFTTEESFIRTVTTTQWGTANTGVAIAEDGTPSAVAEDADNAQMTIVGKYHGTQFGLANSPKFIVPVDGPVKISIGSSYYEGTYTITDGNGTEITSFSSLVPGKLWSRTNTDVVTYIYTGEATTLTITGAGNSYCPYFAVEKYEIPEPKEWRDIKLDFTTDESFIRTVTTTQWGTVNTGVAIAEDGTPSAVEADTNDSRMTIVGKYHGTQYGLANSPKFIVPVDGPVKISIGSSYYEGTYTVTDGNGAEITSFSSLVPGKLWSRTNTDVVTYEYKGEATTLTITGAGNSYCPYFAVEAIKAPEPGPEPTGWVDFEIDMRGNKFLTEASAPSTVGFKKSGSSIVACDVNDAEALGTITGRSRNDDHGLVSFSMTVAVPGYVKIEAGTCAWGGNLTISGANGFSTTVNTNNGNCFHGNTTANRVVAYYSMDEATTLTIAGGNYMPFIKITKVEAVPQQFTVTFKNGSDVTTKKIYEGTALGTLPNVEASGSKYFLGWYSDVNKVDTRAAASTVPTADVTYTAIVKDININEDGYYQPEAGDAFSFLAHLEKANATATADSPAKIFIPNGTYDLGTLINTEVKNNVHIFGESRDDVTIVNHPAQAGMSSSETLNVRGSNVYMQNFTVRCDVSYTGSVANGVGTAIRTYGDKNIFYNLNLQGNQDTFNTPMGESARAYVKNGRIEGTVDYICGSGNIWFESVNLYMNQRSNADVIAAPSTAANTEYGYVFNSCTIDGDAAQAGNYNLSRGWKDSPAATWINTNCIIKPSDKGYTTMTKDLVCRFHEYNTMYNGEAVTGHNLSGLGYSASSDNIYLSAIGNYTYEKVVMASDGWDPEAIIAAYNPIDVTVGETGWATFSAQYDAVIPTGMTAYYVSATDQNTVTLKKIEDEAVAKNTGLIIAAAQGSYTFAPASSQTYTELGDMNKLKATSTGAYTCENAGDIFVLTKTGENTVGMRKASAGLTLAENKAYLPAQPNQAKSLQFIFEDDATAIMMESSDTKKFDGPIYDAAGRQTNSIMRGINIMNGIKVAK